MPPYFPSRLQTGSPPLQTDPRLRSMDPTAVPGGGPPGGQPGSRFGALLAGGLGGMGQGMMTPEFRRAYQAGQGGVEEAQTQIDQRQKELLTNSDAVDRFLRRKALMNATIEGPVTL